jgi:Rne/Rng family ribonuclease
MAKELIVSVNGREKKIAIIENEKVTEFYIERGEGNQGIVGNIYKGRVMRVLPGMQSAFVDIGLERDAFLYVSDFFDEEEEFERIVMDKSKKGEAEDAERIAAEQIALGRVEREHLMEATQERAEPLLEIEATTPLVEAERTEDSEDLNKRRGRRGRRRGRGQEDFDAQPQTPAESTRKRITPEEIGTPFVAADPSVHRIIDDEEIAAVNGEMFKDARLQERLFDQIHAGEFNLEDDFRTAEVGSVISSSELRDGSFQRVADDEEDSATSLDSSQRRREPIAAHIEGFVDDVSAPPLQAGGFHRVSDDEESANELSLSEMTADEAEETESAAKGRTTARRSRLGKLLNSVAGKKKPATRRSTKKPAREIVAESVGEDEATETENSLEPYEDAEAHLTEGGSRAEFATRRGGRRRRRPTKSSGADATTEAAPTDDISGAEPEVASEPDVIEEPVAAASPAAKPAPARNRARGGRSPRGGFSRRDRHQPTITDLLREGQEILVQIAKEPIAKKGARITSHIALPGRFLVYMPTVEHVGVSRKIESDSERQRLRKLITLIRGTEDIPSGGFIVRTAGVGISEADLREDVRYLVRTWLDIRATAEKTKPATLVHKDLDLVQRILRDQLSDDFAAIRVDSEEEYQGIVEFINRIQPRLVKRVKLYTRDRPILEAYGVQVEIDKAIKPRVWLKSGGYLVINQTEALVAIDVNTGKFVGRGSGRLEDTITRTNLEAVEEIVRQIRLRDLGGIIVLDLIDMEERRNRQKVMQTLQDALRNDKSPTKVLSFNDFGLVIMTRKRVKQSLERTLCAPCQYCQGAGLIKSPQTVCYELLEEARTLGKAMNGDKANKQTTLRIHPEVARALRNSERDVLNEIEEYLGPVDINSDPMVHQEQFDFAFI